MLANIYSMLPNVAVGNTTFNNSPRESSVAPLPDQQVTFNGLPAEIIQNIASKLPLPDIIRLKQVCKHTYNSIEAYDINEAKKRCSFEFQNMKKVEYANPDLFTHDMRLFKIHNEELTNETSKVPSIQKVSFQFVLTEFTLPGHNIRKHESRGLNDALSIHIGQFENGVCFILALNPRLSSHFIEFSPEHQMIGYAGDICPTQGPGENIHSMYCGRSYEDAIKTYELTCKGSLLATHIRELLGFQKKYY